MLAGKVKPLRINRQRRGSESDSFLNCPSARISRQTVEQQKAYRCRSSIYFRQTKLQIKPTNASKNLHSPTFSNTVGVRFGVRAKWHFTEAMSTQSLYSW